VALSHKPSDVIALLDSLKKLVRGMAEPMSVRIAHEYHSDPFAILVSCLLSLRARDTVTYGISKRLLAKASTPQKMLTIPMVELEKIVYPAGFYHRKATTLKAVSKDLIERFNGKVPSNRDDLLSLPGVGRKTANLVLSEAFGIPAICVDTHVHRLANQLGLVSTKTPEQTEYALEKIIPKNRWIETHRLLVMCGQNKCDISKLVMSKKSGHH
jgi:endonuclease III